VLRYPGNLSQRDCDILDSVGVAERGGEVDDAGRGVALVNVQPCVPRTVLSATGERVSTWRRGMGLPGFISRRPPPFGGGTSE